MFIKEVVIACLKIYRLTSVFRQPVCRFYPTCSAYAIESLEYYGLFKGLYKTFIRLFKCHPWHDGGIDLVTEEIKLGNKEG